jgi:hypothetical protein
MAIRDNQSESGWIKLDLLSHGIALHYSFHEYLRSTTGIAHRKNFYNNPVWLPDSSQLPQEIRVLGAIVGLNCYGRSPWCLSWNEKDATLVLAHISGVQYMPELIPDLKLFTKSVTAARVANLYGGAALAFFSPRTCYFFADGNACGFCSLAGTAEENSDFQKRLSLDDVHMTVRLALATDPGRIEQIMIVGGNMRDLDRGFQHHVGLARAADIELRNAGLSEQISVHIATMPPRNLDLLRLLADFGNVHVMFNLEVWDADLFPSVCPGKEKDYGRHGIMRALEALRDVIGPYRAHSLLVTGIEQPQSTADGVFALANLGISPIVNVYHSDRHSRIGLSVRPSFAHLAHIARVLQEVYAHFPVRPYWRNCGRNAIDAEAKSGLFRIDIPDFLCVPPTSN